MPGMLTVRDRGKRIASSRPVWVTEKVPAIMGSLEQDPISQKGRERRKGGREREERREGCHVLSFTDKNESYPKW